MNVMNFFRSLLNISIISIEVTKKGEKVSLPRRHICCEEWRCSEERLSLPRRMLKLKAMYRRGT